MAKKRRKSKKKKKVVAIEDTDYLRRFQLFDLLRKLGLKSPPTWFGGMDEAQFMASTQAALTEFLQKI